MNRNIISSFSDRPYLRFLEGCSSLDQLKQIHAQIITFGLTRFTYFTSRLLAKSAISENGDFDYARTIFDQTETPTSFDCNSMIMGYSKTPNPERGLSVYARMQIEGIEANTHTFPALVKTCVCFSSLSLVHGHIMKLGYDCDFYVISSIISMYSKCGRTELARQVFEESPMKNVPCWTSLISGYCFNGLIDQACEIFEAMPERNDVSYSAMISGYVQNDQFNEAIRLFRDLKICTDLRSNPSILVSVLNACGSVGAFEEGKWVHSYINENLLGYDLKLGTALIDFHAKCGFIKHALEIFSAMNCKDITAWSSVIMGLAINGENELALRLFNEMERSGLNPNAVTFIGVLTACNHTTLINEAWRLFGCMAKVYGIFPLIEHYGCMVDLLARAGKIKGAKMMISTMPMEPDGIILGSMLNGCMMHGYAELAERVGKLLIQLEPQHSGRYVIMANMYANIGWWEGVVSVRNLMKETGAGAVPAWSFVEVNGVVHKFVANDKSHPQWRDIDIVLNKLKRTSLSSLFN